METCFRKQTYEVFVTFLNVIYLWCDVQPCDIVSETADLSK